jgi:hypothetical protein
LPPLSTPLKVPPPGPTGTVVRTVTGMVVWPWAVDSTTDFPLSPGLAGLVRVRRAVAA